MKKILLILTFLITALFLSPLANPIECPPLTAKISGDDFFGGTYYATEDCTGDAYVLDLPEGIKPPYSTTKEEFCISETKQTIGLLCAITKDGKNVFRFVLDVRKIIPPSPVKPPECPGKWVEAKPGPYTSNFYASPGGDCSGPKYICSICNNPYSEFSEGEAVCISPRLETVSSDYFCDEDIEGTFKANNLLILSGHYLDPSLIKRIISCDEDSDCWPNEKCTDNICQKIADCIDTDRDDIYTQGACASEFGGNYIEFFPAIAMKQIQTSSKPLLSYDFCLDETNLYEPACDKNNKCISQIKPCPEGTVCSSGVCKPRMFGEKKGLLTGEVFFSLPEINAVITGIGAVEHDHDIRLIMLEYREVNPNCSLGERRTISSYGRLDDSLAGEVFLSVPDGNYGVTGFGIRYSDQDLKGIMLEYQEINPDCTLGEKKTDIAGAGFEAAQYAPENHFISGIGIAVSGNSKAYTASAYREFLPELDLNKEACEARLGDKAWLYDDKETGTPAENYCCGDDKEKDLGAIADFEEQLCYQDDSGEWGWRYAGTYSLSILEINKTDSIYDVASNGFKWYACGSSKVPYGDALAGAPSIICYAGNKAYAQCCADSDTPGCEDNPESKKRYLGELISALGSNASFAFNYDYPLKEYIGSEAYQAVTIEETKTKITDWSSYKSLEFDIMPDEFYDVSVFVVNAEGTDVNNPDEVEILFKGHLYDYVVDTPKLDEWQHVVIPLASLTNKSKITDIVFYADTTELDAPFTLEIKNINLISSKNDLNIYCSKSADFWIADLDKEENACSQYSFDWTGTKCCGDDLNEYYLDTEAGCWNSNIVNATIMEIKYMQNDKLKSYICYGNECLYPLSMDASATVGNVHVNLYKMFLVNDDNETLVTRNLTTSTPSLISVKTIPQQILFANQTYYGCSASPYIYTKAISAGRYDASTKICDILGEYFCSPSLGWSSEESPEGITPGMRNTTSSLPDEIPLIDAMVKSNCCAPDYCWNGTACIESMHSQPNATYSFEGINDTYRCIYGTWGIAVEKYDWNNDKLGFCPRVTDCLVNPDANAENNYNTSMYLGEINPESPQCIADKQYIEDHYCINGSWTSRTKHIASVLLDSVTSDFVLYCDDYKTALPSYEYVNDYIGGRIVSSAFGLENRACFTEEETEEFFGSDDAVNYYKPCVNNFCILKTNKVSFGTSLNREINDNQFSFLYALLETKNKNYCFEGTLSGEGDYKKCQGSDKVWYNNITNSIIYSKDGIQLTAQTSLQKLWNFFTSLIQWVTGTFAPSTPLGQVNLTFFEKVKDYNRLYAQKKGDKEIYAVIEKVDLENTTITVEYRNLDTDVCDSVEKISREEPYKNTFCTKVGFKYIIVTDQPSLFSEMTSKLRLD